MKAINWTLTAALLRTLLILGASTFVGAIVLPVGVDGTLPVSWAAWKPIVAVGLSASAVAEWLWIRTHLSQAAQALGLPAIAGTAVSAAATVAKTSIVILGLGFLLRGTTACGATPVQVATDVGIGAQALGCVLGVYATDEAAGKQWPTIVEDSVIQCGKYGITAANASSAMQAHRMAEMKEGFALRPIQGEPSAADAAPPASASPATSAY